MARTRISKRTVYRGEQRLATIRKTAAADPGHRAHEPWVLEHRSGRIDRFASFGELRDETRKL